MTLHKYLNPSILAQLQGLELKARLVVEGTVSGKHRSPFKGFSVEFAEHKSYYPGDDIRYIDWKLYAKTNKFFIKQFDEDTNLKTYILLDMSGSMNFGTEMNNKSEFGKFLTVALSYLMLAQRDSVGLLTFTHKIGAYIPPRNTMDHLHYIVTMLEQSTCSGSTGIAKALHYLANKIKRRGLIIIISDLIDRQQNVLSHLRYLHTMKHEIIVLHLVHPDELTLPYKGTVQFTHPERQDNLTTLPDRIRKNYSSRIQSFIEAYEQNCIHEGIDYHRIMTDNSLEDTVLRFIAKRKRY
ncbi:DUF58 domain-containing protein [bacterium]|nr:DUF58 domain-containing protein [bacterium]MCP5461624.1 DUF58 domain-containing protein [bacterium]